MPRRNKGLRGEVLSQCSPSAAKVSHLKLTPKELQRKRGLFAYEDGYADAREYGQDGFFIPEEWSGEQRLKYLAGFERGCEVHKAREAVGAY